MTGIGGGIVRSKVMCGITLGAVAAFGVATRAAAQSQPSRPLNAYEQAAIKVVSDWTAAWQAKDPDKMASLVTDDIKFRLDPSEATFRVGREKFLCQMRGMAGGGGGLGGLVIKNPSYQAVGDKVYVLVIQRRTDMLQAAGRGGAPGAAGGPGGAGRGLPPELAGDIPVGASFIVKNGKIAEWVDVTLALDITTLQRGGGPGGGPGGPSGGRGGCD
jgi:ketosteroid isomerase-like protein